MAKADKPDTSTESKDKPSSEIAEDVIDAEIVEDMPAEDVETEEVQDAASEDTTQPETSDEDTAESDQEQSEEAGDDVEDAAADALEEDAENASEETEVVAEASEPAEASTSPTPAPVKKVGFFPVALGGVVAAALGFGASQYVGPLLGQKDDALVTLEQTVAAQAAQIETLLSAQAQTESAATAAQSSVSAFQEQVAGFEGAVSDVNGQFADASQALATLDGRLTALEKNPITQNLPSSAIAAYERELEDLKALVTAQRAEAETMEENAKLSAQEALARAALTRVQSALDSGASYRLALTDLGTATGTSIPEALNSFADEGVPTLAVLQDEFPAAARAALAASRVDLAPDEGRLTSFLKAQVGMRSLTPQEGTDADAVLSRAEAALRRGDVGVALTELNALEDAAKAEVSSWVEVAQNRQAAFEAADALSQSLNAK